MNGVEVLCGLDVVASRADAAPEYTAPFAPKGHAEIVKVLQDGSKRAEQCDAEDHVVAVDQNGVAVDSERLVGDADADVAASPRQATQSPFAMMTPAPGYGWN